MQNKPITKKEIYINGRFLTQAITGVQRTAYELVTTLDKLIAQGFINNKEYSFTLIYSGVIKTPVILRHIKIVKRGLLEGTLWEQVELPFFVYNKMLVSLCSISCLFKKKQIVMVHDASFLVNPSFFSYLFRTWYKVAIIFLRKIAIHFITVSNFSKGELIKHAKIPTNKISIIYNSAEHILHFAEADENFKNKISALKPYILAVSSLGANKNFTGISNAIKKVDLINYHMLVAGGDTSTLQKVKLDAAIKYLGYVSNEQLKFLYINASLFIFPSFYEGFGIPPLEAMICGCPVLSSNTSSLPEILEDACYYCNPYDPDDIAEKINLLINNKNLRDVLKEKGFRQTAKYTWEESGKKLFDLIKEYCE